MKAKGILRRTRKFTASFCVTNEAKFRLKDSAPGDTLGLKSEHKPRAKEALALGVRLQA